MLVAVTGASGLVGANLTVLLREAGHRVRCTRRAASRTDHLEGLGVEWVEADVEDRASLVRAFDGAEAVFHCAAKVSIRRRVTPDLVAANVVGTENVLAAVASVGGPRLVHCSTVGARAISTDGRPVTEDKPYNFAEFGLDDGYSLTKRDAERAVVRAVAGGADAVIVNPSYMFGPYDVRPSSGAMILEVMRGKMPGATSGVNNYVDVRDVCRGMIAAWQKGARGEAYILGGYNLTYREIFDRVAAVAGVRPPRLAIPFFAGRLLAWALEGKERLTGREAFVNSATVRYACCTGFCFSSEKATRELGYAIGPLEPAIRDAIEWFRAHGMLPGR